MTGIVLAAIVISLSGCAGHTASSSPGALPDFGAKERCERDGLFWHVHLGICEKI